MVDTTPGERSHEAGSRPSSPLPLLRVSNISVRFGGIVALDDLSFDIAPGQIVGLIGPNGAGKTTLFNCLSRLYPFEGGDIVFGGTSLRTVPRHRIAALGIGRTFQNLALFRSLSIFDNILLGRHCHQRCGFIANAFRTSRVASEETEATGRATTIVRFLGLEAVASQLVAAMPFGTQKRVELGRALASEPKLLLLDEPASGLNHAEVDLLVALIRDIRDRLGITILLVEHHMGLVMRVSDRVVALDFGRKIADGTPSQVREDPELIRAYLGTGSTAKNATAGARA